MSETKMVAINKETRNKLKLISKRFSELNTGAVGDILWMASDQGNSGYDWGQFDLGINKSGELVVGYQNGCSCYGPEEPVDDTSYSLNNPIEIEDDYYNALEPAVKELNSVADILVKVFDSEATPKEIISLPNAEIRRAAIEYIGYEKMTEHAKVIDASDVDGELMVIELPDDENLTLLHVKDPSTTREYFLRVPPTMKTAKQARAWTFGFKENDFVLDRET